MPELKYDEALSKAAIGRTNDIGQFGLTGQEGSWDTTKMGESAYYSAIKANCFTSKILSKNFIKTQKGI